MNFLRSQLFRRYERPIELSNESSDNETSDDEDDASDEDISYQDLRLMIMDMIECRLTPEYAKRLQDNLVKRFRSREKVFCKIVYLIDLKTVHWTDYDKKTFLFWYYQMLADKIKKQNK